MFNRFILLALLISFMSFPACLAKRTPEEIAAREQQKVLKEEAKKHIAAAMKEALIFLLLL